ncbi:hypothetical protein SDC9_135079 [bioreactor metagenome]|uniref:Uncharacterized protein n=1 Tax=bioreactor metagenome TaxID=1076179 RepID=A0A645DG13_9ZZZZ
MAVRHTPVVQYLQHDVEYVRVSFFYLVEQHDRVGMAAHGFGELPALLIADISRRRSHEARYGVLLHIF